MSEWTDYRQGIEPDRQLVKQMLDSIDFEQVVKSNLENYVYRLEIFMMMIENKYPFSTEHFSGIFCDMDVEDFHMYLLDRYQDGCCFKVFRQNKTLFIKLKG